MYLTQRWDVSFFFFFSLFWLLDMIGRYVGDLQVDNKVVRRPRGRGQEDNDCHEPMQEELFRPQLASRIAA